MGRLLAWIKVEPLLAVVLWGAVYPGAKLGLRVIRATSFAALRRLVASTILTALSRSRGRLGLPRDLRRQARRAALAQTAFQVLLIAGLRALPGHRQRRARHPRRSQRCRPQRSPGRRDRGCGRGGIGVVRFLDRTARPPAGDLVGDGRDDSLG